MMRVVSQLGSIKVSPGKTLCPHGLMHTVIANCHAGDPYKIDTHSYMAIWHGTLR